MLLHAPGDGPVESARAGAWLLSHALGDRPVETARTGAVTILEVRTVELEDVNDLVRAGAGNLLWIPEGFARSAGRLLPPIFPEEGFRGKRSLLEALEVTDGLLRRFGERDNV